MNLGIKIQQLRKSNGLSQEQLADQLNVSRQAISKWELGESTPDIDKVVQLSKVFQVSTDYLLMDGMNSDTDIPDVKPDNDALKKQYGMKTLFTVSTGTIIIGLIMSIVAQFTWQTLLSVSVGFVVQLIGVVAFEALYHRYVSEGEKPKARKIFYATNLWFILPFPVIVLSQTIFRFVPRPYGTDMILFCAAIIYFIICAAATFFLMKPTHKNYAA